ncbi:23151_t:CDS:2 [Racocetra persica]|uniref:23151_t:CDS:1 n=1 Tax=Racocetra persica TaxID=160502 RepID=A0ACA9Q1W7_9GLOM|nr:23151_t:CDS:2 [Racocetra persica]
MMVVEIEMKTNGTQETQLTTKYINLYQEKLKGNGQENETIVNQAIKEVKALIGEIDIYISDRSIEYDIKRHLISFKELAQRNIEEEKKD